MLYEDKEYSIMGVGNYQLCFSKHCIIPLNRMQEDKIILAKTKKFLVLRHATFDFEYLTRIFRMHGDKIERINMSHEGMMLADNNKKVISSIIKNAKLRYVAQEGECAEFAGLKIVIEFDHIEFADRVKNHGGYNENGDVLIGK